MKQFEAALDAVYRCVHTEDLTATMQKLARHLGYGGFCYMSVRQTQIEGKLARFSLSTLNPDFVKTYRRENFINCDPAFLRVATTNAPFVWTDIPEYQDVGRHRRGPKPKARKVIETANDFGYTQGFVVPVHSVDANGELASAFISLFWQDSIERFNPQETMPLWLRLIVLSFHERVLELRGVVPEKAGPRPSLTDRERDCLGWACCGKTTSETAIILNVSERTVEFHIQNAMKKLGVHTKAHAIAVAIQRGLLIP